MIDRCWRSWRRTRSSVPVRTLRAFEVPKQRPNRPAWSHKEAATQGPGHQLTTRQEPRGKERAGLYVGSLPDCRTNDLYRRPPLPPPGRRDDVRTPRRRCWPPGPPPVHQVQPEALALRGDRNAIGAVVVDFPLLFRRGAVIVFEVLRRLDHDGAGVRRRLPFLWRSRRGGRGAPRRRRRFRPQPCLRPGPSTQEPPALGSGNPSFCRCSRKTALRDKFDAVAFDAKNLHHHLITLVQTRPSLRGRDARQFR